MIFQYIENDIKLYTISTHNNIDLICHPRPIPNGIYVLEGTNLPQLLNPVNPVNQVLDKDLTIGLGEQIGTGELVASGQLVDVGSQSGYVGRLPQWLRGRNHRHA